MYAGLPIIAAALFVWQSILLKNMKGDGAAGYGQHAAYMLLVGLGCLAAWGIYGNLHIRPATAGIGIVYGIDFALTMIIYARALSSGPLSYSSFCFSASMLIPVLASSVLWKETMGYFQGIGLLLFLLSAYLILIVDGKRTRERPRRSWYLYILLAFVLNGLLSVWGKLHQLTVGGEMTAFLGTAFITAAIVSLAGAIIQGKRRGSLGLVNRESLATIGGLALATGVGNGLVVWLTPKLPGAYLFPAVSGSLIVGMLLVSRFRYGERLTTAGWLGMSAGIVAILLVNR